MQTKTILIVEDEGIVALDLQTRLKNAGYFIPAIFSSGEDFLQNWKKFHPDIVLMDIMLKGKMDGIETATELRKISSTPVVFLTAYSDNSTFEKGKNTDAYGYLIKPVQTKDLLITLEMALHRQQLENELKLQKNWNQAILGSLSEGILVIDQEGNIIFHNKEIKNIFGLDEIPNQLDNLVQQFDPEVLEHLILVKEKKIQIFIPETKIKKEFGYSLVEIDMKGFSFDGKNCCLIVFRSLTEKYESRLAISRLENKYKQLFEQQTAGIYITDLNGKILLSNESFAKMLGYSDAFELKSKNITEFKNLYEFQQLSHTLVAENKILQYETIYTTKDHQIISCIENFILREEDGIKTIECIAIDISEKKKIEEERDLVTAEMLAAIENSDNLIWSVDKHFNLTSFNSAFYHSMQLNFGKTPTIGTSFEHAEKEIWNDFYNKVLTEGKFNVEQSYQSYYGQKYFVFYLNPIIKNGLTIGVSVQGIDITEQKKEEREKKSFLEIVNAVYTQSDDAFFLFDLETNKVHDCNKKALEIAGIQEVDEIKNIDFLKNLFQISDWRKLQVRLRNREDWSGEIKILNQTKDFWGDLLMMPLEIPGHTIMLIRVTDITKKKEAERMVAILETAIKSSSEAILIVELKETGNHIIFANQAYADLTGYTALELVGNTTSILKVQDGDQSKYEFAKTQVTKNQPFEVEFLALKKNGQKFVSSNLFSPILDQTGEVKLWAIFTRDVTDKKKKEALVIETSLQQQKLLLQTIIDTQEEERLKFSEELHDGIGPTLSALKLNFATLEKYFNSQEAGKNTFEFTLELLDSVIRDIRNISHGLMPSSLEYLGLVQAINELCKSFKGVLKINFYAYNFENRVDKSYEITLYRVLQELLNNVVKHAKAQTVDIQLTNLEDVLLLTVEDDGVGFDVTDKSKWKGIGLRNIMNRIQLFGGTFTMDSAPGKGTMTIVEFPIN